MRTFKTAFRIALHSLMKLEQEAEEGKTTIELL